MKIQLLREDLATHLFSDKRSLETPVPGYTTYAEIEKQRLIENVHLLKQQAGQIKIMAVVKADAYGHGMSSIATFLAGADINRFLVATLDEALQLRTLLPESHILVASPPNPANLPIYAEMSLQASVTSQKVAQSVMQAAQHGINLKIHIKVDTGMNRLGLYPQEAKSVIEELLACPGITVAGIWSHLATAGAENKTFAEQQIKQAYEIVDSLHGFEGYFHVGNSGTLLNHRKIIGKRDKEIVRLGGALLGIPASEKLARQFGLKPVMSLKSHVTHVKTLAAGDTVSYGRLWEAPAATSIAIIGAGYADGYPSALSGRGTVLINETAYPVIGRVCMDMLMVDLGPSNTSVQPGDEVILFGKNHATIYDLAEQAGLVHYEICCRIPMRVPRHFR